jgi:hypothetical protein
LLSRFANVVVEVYMPRVMVLNKGRKRKLQAIQWTVWEKVSAGVLLLFLSAFCVGIALWMATVNPSDPQKPHPEIRR